jgi:hypothetical protein
MSDSPRPILALLLLGPLALSGCDTINFASLDLSAITMPWDRPAEPPNQAVALREDAAAIPDGMQRDDLRTPFGGTATAASP